MTEPLFSDQWYRVAQRMPRLRANVRVRRQPVRGQLWYVLVDESRDRIFRVDAAAYAFVGRCDGEHTAQNIWETISAELGDGVPAQGALLRLMVQLQGGGLLHFDRQTDIGSMFSRRRSGVGQRAMHLNPLAFRVKFGDPSRWLESLAPLGQVLFRPLTVWLWTAVVLLATAIALFNIDALSAHAGRLLGGGSHLWLVWWVYPPVKLVHEFAHGLAVRRWRGEVHEWGFAMLVLMPMPYVDASAASAFRRASQRAAVSAAGIMAELLIAVLALGVWLAVEPGLVRDVAMTVMVVCSFSTVLVNGNPLLRYDGYFVLTDLLGLPNLAERSRRWWLDQLKSRALGVDVSDRLMHARGERKWLFAYHPLSWLYRLGLSVSITLWLGGISPWLGYAVGVWFAWTLLVSPLVKAVRALAHDHVPEGRRMRSRVIALALVLVVPGLLFGVPVPDVTVADGVVWLPDTAQVRNASSGFVDAIVRHDGDHVEKGDVILRLTDDQLLAHREQLERELEGLQTALFNSLRTDPVQAGQIGQRVGNVQRELARVGEQIDGLSVRAAVSGRLVMPREADMPGRFLPRGEQIGMIQDGSATRVRIALPGEEATGLKQLASVSVHLAEMRGRVLDAQLIGQLPEARRQLPSAALGRPAGGPFAVDPTDKDGLTATVPVVWVDLAVPSVPQQHSGGRVQARFDHGERSLGAQLWRRTRQLLLGRFDPEGAPW